MKTLTLIRHAKSDWGHEGLRDIDRPLNQRGYQDAYFLSQWHKENHANPELIITSSATRNLSTAFIFSRTLEYPQNKIQIIPEIYECTDKILLDIIFNFNNSFQNIMLFAHNSSITNVCNELTGDLFFENIPTCGIVKIQFDMDDWQLTKTIRGKTLVYQFPKNFKQE